MLNLLKENLSGYNRQSAAFKLFRIIINPNRERILLQWEEWKIIHKIISKHHKSNSFHIEATPPALGRKHLHNNRMKSQTQLQPTWLMLWKLDLTLIEQSPDNKLHFFLYIPWEHQVILTTQHKHSFPEDWLTDLEYGLHYSMIIEWKTKHKQSKFK